MLRSRVVISLLESRTSIRGLQPSDSIPELTALLHRAYKRLLDMGLHYTATRQSEELTRRRIGAGTCLVAVLDGSLVGTVTYHRHAEWDGWPWMLREEVATASQFAVEPVLQRQGIGSALMRAVERLAVADGAAELALGTAAPAVHLIDYYTDRGYRFIEHTDATLKHGYRSVIMSKTLTSLVVPSREVFAHAPMLRQHDAAPGRFAGWTAPLVERPESLLTARLQVVSLLPAEMHAVLEGDAHALDAIPAVHSWGEWPEENLRRGLAIHLAAVMADPREIPWRVRVAVERVTGTVVGSVNMKGPADGDGRVEFGWGTSRSHRRQGIAFEAASAVIGWAVRDPAVQTFIAAIADTNEASQTLAAKLGMRRTAETKRDLPVWLVEATPFRDTLAPRQP
jgi:RimJ/RimL family protein N-acetyltransferase/GNAT superfamily N-acetyltransferase